MKISVKVFGRYKDITGKDIIQLDIAEGNTLRDIINEFVKRYPILLADKSRMMITKNKAFTSLDSTVAYDDEITIAPPVVSGG